MNEASSPLSQALCWASGTKVSETLPSLGGPMELRASCVRLIGRDSRAVTVGEQLRTLKGMEQHGLGIRQPYFCL